MSGRGKMNPRSNGEFSVLRHIVKNAGDPVCFIDGGACIGDHSAHFLSMCDEFRKKTKRLFSVEPLPSSQKILKDRLQLQPHYIVRAALGESIKTVTFYYEDEDGGNGRESLFPHYYLTKKIKVKQTTVDALVVENKISKIDFLKLDIEGAEYNALMGASKSLKNGIIDYIQLEYNQTWIRGGGTIEKILGLCERYDYNLYRIDSKKLFSIPSYNSILDDFFFCNLLMVKHECPLPLPCERRAIPII